MFCPQPYTSQRILGHKSRCNDFTHAKAVRHTPSEQVCASVSTMWMSFFAYRRCQEVVFELCVGFFDPVCRHDVGKNLLQNMEIKIRESWWPDKETAFLHSRVSFFSAFFLYTGTFYASLWRRKSNMKSCSSAWESLTTLPLKEIVELVVVL